MRLPLAARGASGTQETRPRAARAQGRSPRCLRVPSRASPAPGSARRRCGDTAGRGQGEERAERGLAPGRQGLAGPRLRQSAGADAGGRLRRARISAGPARGAWSSAVRVLRSGSACCTCQIAASPCAPLRTPLLSPVSPAWSLNRSLTAQRSCFVARLAPGMAQREHRALGRIRRALPGMNNRAFCLHAQ